MPFVRECEGEIFPAMFFHAGPSSLVVFAGCFAEVFLAASPLVSSAFGPAEDVSACGGSTKLLVVREKKPLVPRVASSMVNKNR